MNPVKCITMNTEKLQHTGLHLDVQKVLKSFSGWQNQLQNSQQ